MSRRIVISGVAGLVVAGLVVGGAVGQGYQAPGVGAPPPQGQGQGGGAVLAAPEAGAAHEAEDLATLAAAVQGTTRSLISAIEQVAIGTEVPIEAKFEMEDGKLMMSVYTSAKGFEAIAEENSFKEYKGDATIAVWNPDVEVFEDFEHIARSAQYHTLLSMTDVTIPEIIKRSAAGGAVVVSVKPKVVDGAPVFEVVSTQDGQVTKTLFDLMTGRPTA